MKVLLISGSPRRGNTEFILNYIFQKIDAEKEIIFLKDFNIKHSTGCLDCDKTRVCEIKDDMTKVIEKLLWADLLVIGTPNYFENVSGLLKDFIDRTNVIYGTDKIAGKKVIYIITGGGEKEKSIKVHKNALKCFSYSHKLEEVGVFAFQGEEGGDVAKDKKALEEIDGIADKIRRMSFNL